MTHKDHMSAEARARGVINEWAEQHRFGLPNLHDLITVAIKAAENDALERAANVARHLNGWGTKPAPELAEHIASVIRSLQSKDTP